MGVPLLPVWKLPAHPRRIPWSTTGGFLASPPRAHASPRAGSPLVPGVEIDIDLLSEQTNPPTCSGHLRRALDETDQNRRAEDFRVLGEVWKKYRLDLSQFEDSPEFLLDVLQLLKKAEAVAQSRALLRAILMPDAIIDRRRPGNGKTSEFGARLGGRSCADRCGITSPRGSLAAWSARWLWPGTRHPHRSRRWCWGNRWPGS